MFGFFRKRKPNRRWFYMGLQVGIIHEQMRAETPGAAYIFARTLHNARDFIDNDALSVDQRIAEAQKQLNGSGGTSNVDGGVSILALQFLIELLKAMRLGGSAPEGMLSMSAAFSDIVKHGIRYRDLEARDRYPPRSDSLKQVLAKSECHCVAELINPIHREHQSMGTDSRDDVWSLLAFLDIKAEIEFCQLGSYLTRLQSVIATP